MRALEPAETGRLDCRGFWIAYEVFGETTGRPLLLLPTWLAHMRHWRFQVPYFARHGFRVITYDHAGYGLAGPVDDVRAHAPDLVVDQAIDLLDHLGVERADVIGLSRGASLGFNLAARYPDRVGRYIAIGCGVDPAVVPDAGFIEDKHADFWVDRPFEESRKKRDGNFRLGHWPEFVGLHMNDVFTEPHSTRGVELLNEWSLMHKPEVQVQANWNASLQPALNGRQQLELARCPVLLLYGSEDVLTPPAIGRRIVELRSDFAMTVYEGSGHAPNAREPVRANLDMARFLGDRGPSTWRRAASRPKRALFLSSPIGLGHALRDLAIADELRHLVPGVEIDWLTQSPVTNVLEQRGERVHPLSKQLAGESKHIETEMGGEHDLRVFQAFRRMDEILVANFMVFHDVVKDGDYDLWIGDEAWDVDHFLHENPELHTSPFAWLTDFVGWLPMPPDPDGREAFLTTDYNAEMLEHVERFPRVRDAAIFVGNPQDIPPDAFGPGLPAIREWTEQHYVFPGYIQYFDPRSFDRAGLRERFGFKPDECVALATVGGTSVGTSLLKRVIAAYPFAKELIPNLRFIVVAGPRIDLASLPKIDGIEYRTYVHHLYEMLAAVDIALVQGGLSTTMELVAAQRPFLSFPLQGHFEQNRLVPYRLRNYGVPDEAIVDFACASPETIAQRLASSLQTPARYKPIEQGGARRAAERLAALL